MNRFAWMGPRVLLAAFALAAGGSARAATLQNLQVEYRTTPLGIDEAKPRFGWQMASAEPGAAQRAWQVQVKDPQGAVVWDSGRMEESRSLGIPYGGSALKPATQYTWTVTVWDAVNASASASSWFETGLMDTRLAAWEGAMWIGGGGGGGRGGEDLVLQAQYLPIYAVRYTVTIPEGSVRAGFVLGANDPRLMDRHKNIHQLASPRNGSYLKVELDVSGVKQTPEGPALLHIYRAGYAPGDDAARPLRTLRVPGINAGNAHGPHRVGLRMELGNLSVMVDDAAASTAPARGRGGAATAINPLGTGGDFLPYGMLSEIGFAVDAGQRAAFSNVEVAHVRAPGNTLFKENLGSAYSGIFKAAAEDAGSGLKVAEGAYQVSGGERGRFITADPSRNSMPMLRTRFTPTGKPIRSARLYVTARGIYELVLNGQRIGDDHFNPGLTQYNKTHFYQTYDVTRLLAAGQPNVLGAALGEGWWSGLLSFGTIWNHFGDRQSLLAKLVITYEDGTREVVTTNPRDWKYFGGGPTRYSSLFMGEVYDGTREAAVEGWGTAGYDDGAWKAAAEVPLEGTAFLNNLPYDGLALVGQVGETAGVYKTMAAKTVKEVRPGVFVYDLGQNIVGVPRISIREGKAGVPVTIRFAEMLYPNLPQYGNNVGMILTENYRAALSQDVYIQRAGAQTYQPRFTFHGFQYIELTGLEAPLPPEAVQGVVISSIRKLTGEFECSNPRVNQLWSNLAWSNIDNFLSIPTDCPQRNERMGWSGDISVFARTATYVSNAHGFLRRHLRAMRDVQTPQGRFTDIAPVGGGFGGVLWGSAGITVAWEAYQQYGDAGLLAEHYPAMVRYIDYLATTINPQTGLSSDGQLGDWLGPQNNVLGSAFLVTAYHIYDLDIMVQAAKVLNKPEDAARFRGMWEERRAFFARTFLNTEHRVVTPAGSGRGRGAPATASAPRLADTQTAYAVGLALRAFPEELRPVLERHLAATVERENADDGNVMRPKYSLMTGFIGTAWISKALSDSGRTDLAYRQLQNRQYPSWLYSVDQGATTIWERLNGYTVENGFGGNNGMNSFNHYSFGAVGQWLMAYCAGIERAEPGFQRFTLQPHPDPTGEMTWARASYDSPYGRISSGWKVEGETLTYTCTVPANTTATLYLPTSAPERVMESGKPVRENPHLRVLAEGANGRNEYVLRGGSYTFTCPK